MLMLLGSPPIIIDEWRGLVQRIEGIFKPWRREKRNETKSTRLVWWSERCLKLELKVFADQCLVRSEMNRGVQVRYVRNHWHGCPDPAPAETAPRSDQKTSLPTPFKCPQLKRCVKKRGRFIKPKSYSPDSDSHAYSLLINITITGS